MISVSRCSVVYQVIIEDVHSWARLAESLQANTFQQNCLSSDQSQEPGSGAALTCWETGFHSFNIAGFGVVSSLSSPEFHNNRALVTITAQKVADCDCP